MHLRGIAAILLLAWTHLTKPVDASRQESHMMQLFEALWLLDKMPIQSSYFPLLQQTLPAEFQQAANVTDSSDLHDLVLDSLGILAHLVRNRYWGAAPVLAELQLFGRRGILQSSHFRDLPPVEIHLHGQSEVDCMKSILHGVSGTSGPVQEQRTVVLTFDTAESALLSQSLCLCFLQQELKNQLRLANLDIKAATETIAVDPTGFSAPQTPSDDADWLKSLSTLQEVGTQWHTWFMDSQDEFFDGTEPFEAGEVVDRSLQMFAASAPPFIKLSVHTDFVPFTQIAEIYKPCVFPFAILRSHLVSQPALAVQCAVYAHATTQLSLLHLGRFGISKSTALRLLTHKVDQPEFPLMGELSSSWAANLFVRLFGQQNYAQHPTVALMEHDQHAERFIYYTSTLGDPVAQIAVFNYLAYRLPFVGKRKGFSLDDADTCDAALQAMAKEAAHTSQSSEMLNLDAQFPRVWEMREDPQVMFLARDEGDNFDMLEDLAANGDPMANLQIAQIYLAGYAGIEVDRDIDAAAQHLEIAAAAGEPNAIAQLALLRIENGTTTGFNVTQLEEAEAAGSSMASMALAYLYHYGYAVDQNISQAVRYYQIAAADGVPTAHTNLGAIYMTHPDELNMTAAKIHLEAAAEMGVATAAYNLALWHMSGQEYNCKGAFEAWHGLLQHGSWKDATIATAENAFLAMKDNIDDSEAISLRIMMMLSGQGFPYAMENAAGLTEIQKPTYINHAAAVWAPRNRTGQPISECAMPSISAWISTNTHALPCTHEEVNTTLQHFAMEQFLMAAHAGLPYAMTRIAECQSEKSVFCQRQSNRALEWLQDAIDQHFPHAMFAMAHAYATGAFGAVEVPVDYGKAWSMYDACFSADPLAELPISVAKMEVLVRLVYDAAYDFYNGQSAKLEELLADLWGCYSVSDQLFTTTNEYANDYDASSAGTEASHRSIYSSATTPSIIYDDEDDFATMLNIEPANYRWKQLEKLPRTKLGPLQLHIFDAQVCARTVWSLMAGAAVVGMALWLSIFALLANLRSP